MNSPDPMAHDPLGPTTSTARDTAAQGDPSFIETCRLIAGDYRHTCHMTGASQSLARRLFWLFAPSVVALAVFRLSRWAYTHHLKFLAWPLYLFNLYLTGADIPPTSRIGRHCFIGHIRGTIICGEVGDDVTLYAAPGLGGGIPSTDPDRPVYGLPVVGNRVTIGARAMVLGAVHIGDDCVLGAGVLITKDMAPGTTAVNRPPMIVKPGAKEDAPA